MGRVGREDRQMRLDLAQHLRAISAPPDCGIQWQVQTALAIADDAPIGGDFIVFDHSPANGRLQAVLVDASGKGAAAATRSVMLAGAISGLLGEVDAASLLPAVNRHILRLEWEEDFATAVYVDLDLQSGRYAVRVAGHPAAAHWQAGSGRWLILAATGPALGLLAEPCWTAHEGTLHVGDALLVVTDGVVESPGQDLDVGIDRMLGQAERLVLADFARGAQHLLSQRRHIGRDDAQVLLIRRNRAQQLGPTGLVLPQQYGLPPVDEAG